MMIIFNLIYKDKYTGNWIYKRNTISLRYLSGWFWIDLFSVVPFFTVDWFIMTESWACNIHGQLDLNSSAGSRAAATVKMVKLLRMVKLTRVFKASRVLQRFAQDILMTKLEMSYAIIKVMYLIFALSFLAHWQACLWALVSIYMNGGDEGANVEDTWVTHFIATEAAKGKTVSPVDLYIAALYWSMMTLTSIGYGDMVPRNSTERLLSSFYMAISGVTWTYAIGQAAGIASTLDPSRIIYETTMDSLNFYMTERKLPKEMRITLRDYFQSAGVCIRPTMMQPSCPRCRPCCRASLHSQRTRSGWTRCQCWLRWGRRGPNESLSVSWQNGWSSARMSPTSAYRSADSTCCDAVWWSNSGASWALVARGARTFCLPPTSRWSTMRRQSLSPLWRPTR